MTATFLGLNTALRGLEVQQAAIDVTGHNIANASTPGYSRQSVEVGTTDPISDTTLATAQGGQLGTGATVEAIQRAHDGFVQQQIIYQNGAQGQQQTVSDTLGQIADVYNEPSDQGFGTLLSSYFTAWQGLANNPSDNASRATVVARGAALAAGFNSAASSLQALQGNQDKQVGQLVGQVNSITSNIAALNNQIAQVVATGQNANDLADKRDTLVNQLSQIVGITYTETPQGAANISLADGPALVQGTSSFNLGTAPDAAHPQFSAVTDANGQPVTVSGGQLGGAITARDVTIQGQLDSLNTLASNVANAVNTLHQANYDANGQPGVPFFSVTAGQEASSLAVNTAITGDPSTGTPPDYSKVAAAGSAPSSGGTNPEDGNGATAIAQLQEQPAAGQTTTVQAQYQGIISALGTAAQQAQTNVQTGSLVLQHLQAQQSSVSGVSLNEEASNLIQYQNAYEAAARVISTMDQTISDMIQQLGA